MTETLTNRQAILQLRESLRERGADSTYSNRFLYSILHKHALWLIKREESSGRIYKNSSLFKPLKSFEVMEVSSILSDCLTIETSCKIFRTVEKLPECWEDNDGYMIRDVTSVDLLGAVSFSPTTMTAWRNIENGPYFKYNKSYYYFLLDNYLYFPQRAPKFVNILAYFKRDVSNYVCCGKEKTKECVKFLDEEFNIPGWIQGELFSQALQELAGITKRMPEDEQIDTNTLRKGQN